MLLLSGVQPTESVIYVSTFFFCRFFTIYAIIEYWVDFPVLHSRSLLVIYFVYSNVYVSIPVIQFSLPSVLLLNCFENKKKIDILLPV